MRANIHPEYREVLFHDTNADAFFGKRPLNTPYEFIL